MSFEKWRKETPWKNVRDVVFDTSFDLFVDRKYGDALHKGRTGGKSFNIVQYYISWVNNSSICLTHWVRCVHAWISHGWAKQFISYQFYRWFYCSCWNKHLPPPHSVVHPCWWHNILHSWHSNSHEKDRLPCSFIFSTSLMQSSPWELLVRLNNCRLNMLVFIWLRWSNDLLFVWLINLFKFFSLSIHKSKHESMYLRLLFLEMSCYETVCASTLKKIDRVCARLEYLVLVSMWSGKVQSVFVFHRAHP